MRRTGLASISAAAVIALCVAIRARGDVAGSDPAFDTYMANEARREAEISGQIGLNRWMVETGGNAPWSYNGWNVWPYGPLIGRQYFAGPPVEHPVTHELKQVSPTRWTYRPVYAAELLPQGIPASRSGHLSEPLPSGKVELPRPSDLDEPVRPRPDGQPMRNLGPRVF